jgi:hypothetical protein
VDAVVVKTDEEEEVVAMNRTRAFAAIGLVIALGFLFGPVGRDFAAPSNEKTVTLKVQGML